MPTELDITMPSEVPVMTLPNVAFFPQALLPLHIFEPRYRAMLSDVLASDRLFAVAGLDQRLAGTTGQSEPPHRVAGIGIVRACQKNGNGTSNLLLQGLCRVEITAIVSDEPYRRIQIRALPSEPGGTPAENERLSRELGRLLRVKLRLESATAEMTGMLNAIDDPETFVDIAAFNLCESPGFKQKLLETLDVRDRIELFNRRLKVEIGSLRLRKKLQDGMPGGPAGEN